MRHEDLVQQRLERCVVGRQVAAGTRPRLGFGDHRGNGTGNPAEPPVLGEADSALCPILVVEPLEREGEEGQCVRPCCILEKSLN
jgi:hypothetical protein